MLKIVFLWKFVEVVEFYVLEIVVADFADRVWVVEAVDFGETRRALQNYFGVVVVVKIEIGIWEFQIYKILLIILIFWILIIFWILKKNLILIFLLILLII